MNRLQFFIINPWSGVIGPNVGFSQIVEEALSRGHFVHVLCPQKDEIAARAEVQGAVLHIDKKLKLTPRGLSPKMLLEHAGIAYNQMRSTYKVLKNVKPDVVCINAENILLSPAITRFFKVPCAIYVRGARFIELKKVGKLFFGLQKIARPTYLAVSKHVGDGLAELGVPKEQIKVVLNGVDLNKFHPMQADFSLRKEFNIPKKHSLVGTICHLTPRKGVHHLVEIMALLKNKIPNLSCVVVGGTHDTEYAEMLQNKINEHGLSERVKLLGQRTDTARIISCLDMLIHPSETESFGRTIAEAMAMAKPVLGFDVGAVPELIGHNKTGFIVKPFDYEACANIIEELLTNPNLKEKMGQESLEYAKIHFDLKKNVTMAVDVIEGLLK